MDFIARLKAALVACIQNEVQSEAIEEVTSLSAMEVTIKQMMHEVGNVALTEWIEAQDGIYPADKQRCDCGGQAAYVRRREGVSLTLMGRVQYPLDQRLGIKAVQMSAEVVKVAARLGIEDAYCSSQETLMETTLLELSPNSIRQACHQIGEQVEDREAELLVHNQDLAAQNEQRRQVVPPNGYMGRWMAFWCALKMVGTK